MVRSGPGAPLTYLVARQHGLTTALHLIQCSPLIRCAFFSRTDRLIRCPSNVASSTGLESCHEICKKRKYQLAKSSKRSFSHHTEETSPSNSTRLGSERLGSKYIQSFNSVGKVLAGPSCFHQSAMLKRMFSSLISLTVISVNENR